MTATRCEMWRTRRRSWATKRMVRSQPLLQLQQQVHDLRLHGDVERRDELVGDQAFGLDRERPRDADPLALPAGEFVRTAVGRVGGKPHEIEQLDDAARDRRASAACDGRTSASPSIWRTLMRGLSEP